MASELKMPALSPTMEKGTLAKWLVSVGDTIRPGDLIAEIETDKATMEMEADEEGRLSEIRVEEGTEDVAVGTVLAMMVDAVDADEMPAAPESKQAGEADAASVPPSSVPASADPSPARQSEAVKASGTMQPSDTTQATPLARRVAAMNDIALTDVRGTGPNGRIRLADLGIRVIGGAAAPRSDEASEARLDQFAEPPSGVPMEKRKLTTMRRTIARRLSESKRSVPHFYLSVRCDIDPLLALRNEINEALQPKGVRISVNDMVIKAMALAMQDVPDVNVQFAGDALYQFSRVDISMAVAVDGGLITPVIRGAGERSVSDIAVEAKALAEKARGGKLMPEDYEGGTASISNLGMFGIDMMVPVINPPQALILGVGAGVRQPWEVRGEMALATIMSATASFDHRAIDGATAAQFMAALRTYIEEPLLAIA